MANIEAKPAKRHPYPPFTTSTLQQEASRKLGLAPAQTMRIAQRLYEGVDIGGETVGLITYMRTDGVDMAPEAVQAARRVIGKEYGDRYVPGAPRKYTTKAKNAQEAHEAIRPTDMSRLPKHVAKYLEPEQARLYELIWIRTIASQMESAELERTTADIAAAGRPAQARPARHRPGGEVRRLPDALQREQGRRWRTRTRAACRPMKAGDPLERRRIAATQHFTEPPPRYSEASLVKRMEELGIGRPSTYAAVLQTLRDREYVKHREEAARARGQGPHRHRPSWRASSAATWNTISRPTWRSSSTGSRTTRSTGSRCMRDFWRDFSAAIGETKELRTTEVLDALNELLGPHIFPDKGDGSNPRTCPTCGTGQLSLKLGKFGAFIGCSNYPECKYTRQLAATGVEGDGEGSSENGGQPGVKVLGDGSRDRRSR